MTAEPRRYGFHATLKPPFELIDDSKVEELVLAVEVLASEQEPFSITLKVDVLNEFLAIVPKLPCEELRQLAGRCVSVLDPFRRPAGHAEMARRRAAGLSARQEDQLLRWGYPYVFEDFLFHMTLTGRLPPDLQQPIREAANSHFARVLSETVMIGGICLFQEAAPGDPFISVRHFPFSNISPEAAA